MLFLTFGKPSREGKKKILKAPQRFQEALKTIETAGANVKAFYAMLDPYDYVVIIEASDPTTAAKLSALTSSEGEVNWETYMIIPFEEFVRPPHEIGFQTRLRGSPFLSLEETPSSPGISNRF